eukprot:gene26885-4495_t
MLERGYNIATLMSMYVEDIDWRNSSNWNCNNNIHPSRHGTYDGIAFHPFETVFVKSSWHVADPYTQRYSKWKLKHLSGQPGTEGTFDYQNQWKLKHLSGQPGTEGTFDYKNTAMLSGKYTEKSLQMFPRTDTSVYLVDFACYRPPEELKVLVEEAKEHGKMWPQYSEEQYSEEVRAFMTKIFAKSGLSPHSTFLPKSIHPKHTRNPDSSMGSAYEEAEMVMCGALHELLKRTSIKPSEIDILITCTSIYCPTPSLCAMLVNHFNMRSDIRTYHLGGMGCGTGVIAVNLIQDLIKTYHLGGMGCGTGVIAVNLVEDLIKANPGAVVVFVPAEITSYCFYPGGQPNRMVSNVLFRWVSICSAACTCRR